MILRKILSIKKVSLLLLLFLEYTLKKKYYANITTLFLKSGCVVSCLFKKTFGERLCFLTGPVSLEVLTGFPSLIGSYFKATDSCVSIFHSKTFFSPHSLCNWFSILRSRALSIVILRWYRRLGPGPSSIST